MGDVEVRREDQLQINEFGRLNAKLHEKREDRAVLKKQIEEFDDASTELALVEEDDAVKLMLGGESFIDVSEDYATEYCEREQRKLEAELEVVEEVISKATERQKDLKALLYARFGTDINLEEK